MDKKSNNVAIVYGIIEKEFQYSHELCGVIDEIPVIISERTTGFFAGRPEEFVSVRGEFRSHNKGNDGKGRLELFVLADEFCLSDELNGRWRNTISLDGHICRKPVYRKLLHGREITEFLLKVKRAYNRSDYIPCICWGRNARFASGLEVGTRLKVQGRIQSREYFKEISEGYSERRTAYEVSISQMEVVESEKCKDQVDNAE